MKVWKYLLRGSTDLLNLSERMVQIGPYAIQNRRLFWVADSATAKECLALLSEVPGVLVDIEHTGVRSGYGHGRETVRLLNEDGSLIWSVTHIDHCDGPGSACSYSHGPWEEYGTYDGSADPSPELVEALRVKKALSKTKRFQF